MAEAYRIGVAIALASNGQQVLGDLGRHLFGLRRDVQETEAAFGRLKQAIIGAAGVAIGGGLLTGFKDVVNSGKELNEELQKTVLLGGKFKDDIDFIRSRAFEISRAVPTVAPSEAVRLMRDVGKQLGDPEQAATIAEHLERAGYVAGRSSGEKAEDVIKNLLKVADTRGQLFSTGPDGREFIDAAKVLPEIDAAVKGIQLGGGFIKSTDLLQMARQGGPAIKGQTVEAFYAAGVEAGIMMGASKTGTAEMSLFQQFIGGTMTAKTAANLTKAGILSSQDWHSDHGHIVVEPEVAKRFTDMMSDPEKFFGAADGETKIKAYAEKFGITAAQAVFQLFGRQTTQRLVSDYLTNGPQFERARAIFGDILPADQAYDQLKGNSLDFNAEAYQKAVKGLNEALAGPGIAIAIPVLQGLAGAIRYVGGLAEKYPKITEYVEAFVVALGGLLVLGGAMTLFAVAISAFAPGGAAALAIGMLATPTLGLAAVAAGFIAVSTALPNLQSAISDYLDIVRSERSIEPSDAVKARLADPEMQARIRMMHNGYDPLSSFHAENGHGYVPPPGVVGGARGPKGTQDDPVHTVVGNPGAVAHGVSDSLARSLGGAASTGTTGFDPRVSPAGSAWMGMP